MNVKLPDFIFVPLESNFGFESPQIPDVDGFVRCGEHDLAFGMNDDRLDKSGKIGKLANELICFKIPNGDRFWCRWYHDVLVSGEWKNGWFVGIIDFSSKLPCVSVELKILHHCGESFRIFLSLSVPGRSFASSFHDVPFPLIRFVVVLLWRVIVI